MAKGQREGPETEGGQTCQRSKREEGQTAEKLTEIVELFMVCYYPALLPVHTRRLRNSYGSVLTIRGLYG